MEYILLHEINKYSKDPIISQLSSLSQYHIIFKNSYLYKYHKYIDCYYHDHIKFTKFDSVSLNEKKPYNDSTYSMNKYNNIFHKVRKMYHIMSDEVFHDKNLQPINVTFFFPFHNFNTDIYGNYPLPNSIKKITIYGFLVPAFLKLLPKNLQYLNMKNLLLDNYYNIDFSSLPKSLKTLYLPKNFNNEICNLPSSLQKLSIGEEFDSPYSLPNNLKKLYIRANINLVNLPNKLKKLVLTEKFNKPIQNIPNNLDHLYIGIRFNNYVYELPNNLKKLTLITFSQIKPAALPESLETIIFGINHRYTIDKLPSKLKKLLIVRGNIVDITHVSNSVDIKYVNYVYLI